VQVKEKKDTSNTSLKFEEAKNRQNNLNSELNLEKRNISEIEFEKNLTKANFEKEI